MPQALPEFAEWARLARNRVPDFNIRLPTTDVYVCATYINNLWVSPQTHKLLIEQQPQVRHSEIISLDAEGRAAVRKDYQAPGCNHFLLKTGRVTRSPCLGAVRGAATLTYKQPAGTGALKPFLLSLLPGQNRCTWQPPAPGSSCALLSACYPLKQSEAQVSFLLNITTMLLKDYKIWNYINRFDLRTSLFCWLKPHTISRESG